MDSITVLSETDPKVVAFCLVMSFVVLFITEHIGRKAKTIFRPSVGLSYCADQAWWFWELCGNIFAKICSFYTYIDVTEIIETFIDLFTPMAKLVTSPLRFAYGYFNTADTYKYPFLIGLGTVTLMGITVCAMCYFDIVDASCCDPIKNLVEKIIEYRQQLVK
jgi:hypothetical protein